MLCRDEVPEFIDLIPSCNAGICLTDPSDPRYQYVISLRDRIGEGLHQAVICLKDSGAEDAIDCVKMLM